MALFKAKFGQDVDEDSDSEDSIIWNVTGGATPSTEQLEDSLSDVKALFKAKFGQDVDDSDTDSEEDGITWTVTRGVAPSAEQLESHLSDVKALFKAKFGQDLDNSDTDSEERNGTGAAALSAEQLGRSLAEVTAKHLDEISASKNGLNTSQ